MSLLGGSCWCLLLVCVGFCFWCFVVLFLKWPMVILWLVLLFFCFMGLRQHGTYVVICMRRDDTTREAPTASPKSLPISGAENENSGHMRCCSYTVEVGPFQAARF